MSLKGIKGRWMVNGIAVLLLIILLGIAAFSVFVYNYYYTSVRTGLENKAQTASEFFTTYVSKTYLEYYQSAYRYTMFTSFMVVEASERLLSAAAASPRFRLMSKRHLRSCGSLLHSSPSSRPRMRMWT